MSGHPDTLLISGAVNGGDQDKFAAALEDARRAGNPVNYVFLDSPGGQIAAGADISAKIEAEAIATVVGPNDTCASVCVLIFASGRLRYYAETSSIGVHSAMTYDTTRPDGPAVEDESAMAISGYLAREMKRLGVPDGVITAMITTPGDSMHWLKADEIGKWAEWMEAPNASASAPVPTPTQAPEASHSTPTENAGHWAIFRNGETGACAAWRSYEDGTKLTFRIGPEGASLIFANGAWPLPSGMIDLAFDNEGEPQSAGEFVADNSLGDGKLKVEVGSEVISMFARAELMTVSDAGRPLANLQLDGSQRAIAAATACAMAVE